MEDIREEQTKSDTTRVRPDNIRKALLSEDPSVYVKRFQVGFDLHSYYYFSNTNDTIHLKG